MKTRTFFQLAMIAMLTVVIMWALQQMAAMQGVQNSPYVMTAIVAGPAGSPMPSAHPIWSPPMIAVVQPTNASVLAIVSTPTIAHGQLLVDDASTTSATPGAVISLETCENSAIYSRPEVNDAYMLAVVAPSMSFPIEARSEDLLWLKIHVPEATSEWWIPSWAFCFG